MFAYLRQFLAILAIIRDIGAPPDIEAEQSLRQWIINLASVLSDLAEKTATRADDTFCDAIEWVVEDDRAWAVAYSAMVMVFGDKDILAGSPEEEKLAGDIAACMAESGSDKVTFINPLVIISVIRMLVDIIKHFRS